MQLMSKIDLTIVLRAFSIFAIVSGHLGFIHLAGGSFYLIFLSGYNFVRFNYPKVKRANAGKDYFDIVSFVKIYFGFIIKIIVPVLLYTFFIYTFLGRFYLGGVFLVSNFIGPNYADGLTFWFIEVLVQIYVLFGLVMISNYFYFWISKKPYQSFLFGFVMFYILSIVCRMIWDTSFYLDRFPHLMMYIFFAGALVAFSTETKKKVITSAILCLIALEFVLFDFNSKVLFLMLGAIATVWVDRISIPKVLHWPINIIAMSSLFIYLVHFQAKSLIDKLIPNLPAFAVVLFALLTGIIMSECWQRRSKFIQFSKKSFSKGHSK
ncbi:hypothetical protein Q4601_16975 [Shewanella sp. 1_MG-2023]|uniref:hypothetical protein n=1 Tax=unclassified Shewanella TaxID=196818 RepID=UPI0026E13FA6|nr:MULTISPECIES: hypothetical protein [unclassified Shewanella]MDO6613519.1 hypothetical protein [Shewanella sp. 7_MG-2023]MDO6773349.1 hypothetical protein [Shewanella sp. 2_MG-2023]MDO6796000.1 hypothetical protein [Shewanella sp. 1_MG-2023]